MSKESEVEKTARFTRHVIQLVIIIVIIIAVIIGSVFIIGLYEARQTINSLEQAIPVTTITAPNTITVNIPFSVTITTNQIKIYSNIQYVITGDGFNTGIDPNSGTITAKTSTVQVTINENEYQNLAEDDGYYNSLPNSLNDTLGVILTSGAYFVGSADTNIVISYNQVGQTPPTIVQPTPAPTPAPTLTLTIANQKVFIDQAFPVTITLSNYNLPCQYSVVISHDNNYGDGYMLDSGEMTTDTITVQTWILSSYGGGSFDGNNTQAVLIANVSPEGIFSNLPTLQQSINIVINPTA